MDAATVKEVREIIERLWVALGDHRDVSFRLGAHYALSEMKKLLHEKERTCRPPHRAKSSAE